MDYLSSDYRGIARDKLKGNWWISLLATLVAGILGGLNTGSEFRLNTSQFKQLSENLPDRLGEPFVAVYGALRYASTELFGDSSVLVIVYLVCLAIVLIVGSAVRLGHNMFYIDLCNNNSNLSTLFSRFGIFLKAFGLVLFMGLFVFLWSLLLVVPGIIAAYRYYMAPYLMAQHPEMGIREAVNESKRLMSGHKGRLFCLQLSFIGWALLASLTFGIGYLWLIPYVQTSMAAFYLDRTGQGIPLNVN